MGLRGLLEVGHTDDLPPLDIKPMIVFMVLMLSGAVVARGLMKSKVFSADKKLFFEVSSVALVWFATSTCVANYNKWIYFYANGGFNYPMAVTAWHMFLKGTLALLYLLAVGSPGSLKFDRQMLISAVPVGLATGLDICLTNQAVAGYIDLGLVTIVKSSTLVFTYILSLLTKVQPPHLALIASVLVILTGILTALVGDRLAGGGDDSSSGSDQVSEGKTLVGVLLALGAAMCGSIRWVVTELVLKPSSGTSELTKMELRFKVLLYISPAATVIASILAASIEGSTVTHDARWDDFSDAMSILLLVSFGGFAAVGLLFAELALVQIASALTLAVTGHAKDVMTVILGVLVFSEQFTVYKGLGMLIIFSGGSFYVRTKAFLRAKAQANTNTAQSTDYDNLEEAEEAITLPSSGEESVVDSV